MRDPGTDPAVRRRLAMARYARNHNKTQAARHFGCCWASIHAAVQRVAEYERTGDMCVLQNKARSKSGRTRPEVEDWVIEDLPRESRARATPGATLFGNQSGALVKETA